MTRKQLTLFVMGMICAIILIAITHPRSSESATVTTGYTFTSGETNITHTKLNNAVNNATISAIVGADITDGTIATADLGANSVTTAKILDGTIAGADIASRTITSGLIATGAVTGVELATNIDFRAGIYYFTNANTVVNFTNAVLNFQTGQIPAGAITNAYATSKSVVLSNLVSDITMPAAGIWTNVFTYTTADSNASNSLLRVNAFLGNGGYEFVTRMRIDGFPTNYSQSSGAPGTSHEAHPYFAGILLSNVVVRIDANSAGGASDTIKVNPVFAAGVTNVNGTHMFIELIR